MGNSSKHAKHNAKVIASRRAKAKRYTGFMTQDVAHNAGMVKIRSSCSFMAGVSRDDTKAIKTRVIKRGKFKRNGDLPEVTPTFHKPAIIFEKPKPLGPKSGVAAKYCK